MINLQCKHKHPNFGPRASTGWSYKRQIRVGRDVSHSFDIPKFPKRSTIFCTIATFYGISTELDPRWHTNHAQINEIKRKFDSTFSLSTNGSAVTTYGNRQSLLFRYHVLAGLILILWTPCNPKMVSNLFWLFRIYTYSSQQLDCGYLSDATFTLLNQKPTTIQMIHPQIICWCIVWQDVSQSRQIDQASPWPNGSVAPS